MWSEKFSEQLIKLYATMDFFPLSEQRFNISSLLGINRFNVVMNGSLVKSFIGSK